MQNNFILAEGWYSVKQGISEFHFRATVRTKGHHRQAYDGWIFVYYRGRLVGGVYDDRLLVKPARSAISYMPQAQYALPYEGAKEMLLVDNVDDKLYLTGLFEAMYDDLPMPKIKKR